MCYVLVCVCVCVCVCVLCSTVTTRSKHLIQYSLSISNRCLSTVLSFSITPGAKANANPAKICVWLQRSPSPKNGRKPSVAKSKRNRAEKQDRQKEEEAITDNRAPFNTARACVCVCVCVCVCESLVLGYAGNV